MSERKVYTAEFKRGSTTMFHVGKNMKHGALAFLVVAVFPLCGETLIAHAQEHPMNNQKVEAITHAASVPVLKAEFEKSGFPFRLQTLKCAGRDFLWLTVDKGSGGYLIHAFLYELHGASPQLVLHILPAWDRVAIQFEAKESPNYYRSTISARLRSEGT